MLYESMNTKYPEKGTIETERRFGGCQVLGGWEEVLTIKVPKGTVWGNGNGVR